MPQSGTPSETTLGGEWERAKRNERAFIASHEDDTIAASGGTTNLHFKNGSSGTTAVIKWIDVSTQFLGHWSVFDAFSTAPSGGSTVTAENMLMDTAAGDPDSGVMTANSDVSFTADGTHFTKTIPSGGAAGTPVGGADKTGSEPVLEPDREIVVQVTNDSSNERRGSITIGYYELDLVPSDTL